MSRFLVQRPDDLVGIARTACRALSRGQLVAFPTDTVYGLGADPTRPSAVLALYVAKGRPSDKSIPLLVSSVEMALSLCEGHHDQVARLAEAFWPGPLTLVVPAAEGAPGAVLHDDHTVALRMPGHSIALALLREFGSPIATTSANPSGQPSLRTADDVDATFGDHVAVLIDGPCAEQAVASTVVRVGEGSPVILRQGAVSLEMIAEALSG